MGPETRRGRADTNGVGRRRVLEGASAALAAAVANGAITGAVAQSDGEGDYVAQDFFYEDDPNVNRATSERFQLVWGPDDARIDEAFVEGNLANLEGMWDFLIGEMGFEAPSESIYEWQRDGNRYKVTVYITETGLSEHEEGWAFMSAADGFGYAVVHPDAMQVDPPSWTLAHEFAHVVTQHQGHAWVDNELLGPWWESTAEWMREQYTYGDAYRSPTDGTAYGPDTDFARPHYENAHLFQAHGRSYYDSWFLLQYVEENPDDLEHLGEGFVVDMLTDPDGDEGPIFDLIDRLAPTVDVRDILGHLAKRMATQDFTHRDLYREAFAEARRDPVFDRRALTHLERVPDRDGWWRVPLEYAPQQTGFNLIELEPEPDVTTVDVAFEGLVDDGRSDWRAALVADDGEESWYSPLFGDGEASIDASSAETLYLTVAATPEEIHDVSAFWGEERSPYESAPEKARFPYEVRISGAEPRRPADDPPAIPGSRHPNGGGFVADTARVDGSAHVGPNAMVLGNATVEGDASVRDFAIVADEAVVRDDGRVLDHGTVLGDTLVADAGVVEGSAVTRGCEIRGEGAVGGDYYGEGQTVDDGVVFGWLPDDAYVDARTNEPGALVAYDFAADEDGLARDGVGARHGVIRGDPEATDDAIRLNGFDGYGFQRDPHTGVRRRLFPRYSTGQYVLLPDRVLDYDALEITVTCRWEGGKPNQRLWSLGSSADRAASLTPADEDGHVRLRVESNDAAVAIETARELETGTWTELSVTFGADGGELAVDGETVGTNPDLSVSPRDLRADDDGSTPHRNYLGRGASDDEPSFVGEIASFEIRRA